MTAKVKSISSGNPELDLILKGGFPANSINVIMGQPGSGKTIFAEQLAFHHAGLDDRPILYLTTLSEPLSKVLTYLQLFSFFDEDKIGKSIFYEDIGYELMSKGLGTLQKHLNEAIHSIAPKIIIIDSFKALHDVAENHQEMRRMLHELASMLSAYETTVFLLGEYTEDQAKILPEFAVADGILQLMRKPLSSRDERYLRVVKLRGSSYLEGMHGFKLTKDGMVIYPRLISPEFPEDYKLTGRRVSSGVPGLDALLAGGFLEGSTTLLAGATGAGKTTAALQFVLDGVNNGEPGLYINFQENPTQLARSIEALGGNIAELKTKGLHLYYMSPVELQIDSIVVTIFRLIRDLGVRRIVIDAAGDLITAADDPNRIHDYLYSLNQFFSLKGITTILTFETMGGITNSGLTMNGERFSYMSDTVILLNVDFKTKAKRTLSVIKQRASGHDLREHDISIEAKGMSVKGASRD